MTQATLTPPATARVTALAQFLDASAARRPHHVAVEDPASGGSVTYELLSVLSDRLRDWLRQQGLGRNDRVGIYVTKSIDTVAALFGVLKCGAAYVPADPHAPTSRAAFVFGNCSVKAVVVEARFAEALRSELAQYGAVPPLLVLPGAGDGTSLEAALAEAHTAAPFAAAETVIGEPEDLAYLLYTSGSTGRPKGVILSQRNAVSFVDWCSEALDPHEDDRFSSHAPFHFDLSILDIYVPIKHGATLVLISHETGKEPGKLAPLIAERRISVWYSTPSILTMLARYGSLGAHDFAALRIVHFAGEVFPIKHLRELVAQWPGRRYFNLYGPTETNVCTFYEVPLPIDPERSEPFPIGKTCSHLRSRVVDERGLDVPPGEAGELCMAGASVTRGYWGLEEQTRNAYFTDAAGEKWYRTGDLVTTDAAGDYLYRGRRDRMVKKRGYRVELGEIEACLYQHAGIRQAAVIAVHDEEEGLRVKAFVSLNEGEKASVIALKRFCSERLPLYMVPDLFAFLPDLPTTSTDKVDYQRLKELP
ncbi:MAG: amino acid adenylation domain-containing protein [Pirellulales bacterium]|nr:amino acid adenylation domain-containing protein [Pirellulales bacterium]